MTIYLYIKVHTKTGLKYFGKTTRNVNQYYGSGKYWQKHISSHGKTFVKTLKIWEFSDLHECSQFALKFSKDNNIVNSSSWANLREENGNDGAPIGHKGCVGAKNGHFGKQLNKGKKHSEASKELRRQKLKDREFTPEWKEKIRQSKLGKVLSEEHKAKMRGPRGPLKTPRLGKPRGPYKLKAS
jgi:hypothetical protein